MLDNWRVGDVVRTPTGRRATIKEFRRAEDGIERMRVEYAPRDDAWLPVTLPRTVRLNQRGNDVR